MTTIPLPETPAPRGRSLRIDLLFTLLGPLHHGQGVEGNVALFRTQRFLVDGEPRDLPALSGASLKHTLIREPGVRHMLATLGVEEHSLSRGMVYLLYSGGTLSTKGTAIDVRLYDDLAELVPVIGLCGAAFGNTMMGSRLEVGWALPVCRDHRDRIPVDDLRGEDDGKRAPAIDDRALKLRAGQLMDVVMGTRHDPCRSPEVRAYLAETDRKLLDGLRADALAAKVDGERSAPVSQQMIFERQVLAAGTQLHSRVHTNDLKPREEAALWAAIATWRQRPYLGAASSVGYGESRLRIFASERIDAPEPQYRAALIPEGIPAGVAAGLAMVSEYEAHLREHSKDILSILAKASA